MKAAEEAARRGAGAALYWELLSRAQEAFGPFDPFSLIWFPLAGSGPQG